VKYSVNNANEYFNIQDSRGLVNTGSSTARLAVFRIQNWASRLKNLGSV